jgi:hypothetical protein
MKYHQDAIEAQVCPLCNPGVFSEEAAGDALERAHQMQGIVWEFLKTCPTELLLAELTRRQKGGK